MDIRDSEDEMTPRIFLVEDDEMFVKLLAVRLKQGGYELVGNAASGEDALQQVEILHPDLVLMDMGLTGRLDGIDTAERVRVGCGIPVIFLTASDDQADLQRAKHTEPFGYLTKPFRQQDLVSAIEIALYKSQIEHKLKQREAWLATTLRCVGDGMIVTDASGHIVFINEIAKRIFCIREAEIIGRKFSDIVALKSKLTGTIVGDLVQLAIMQGGTMDIGKDLSIVGSLQGEANLEGEISLSEVEGAIAGSVFTFRDTTIRQHEEEQHRHGLRKRAVNQLTAAFSTELKHVREIALASAQQVLDEVNAGQPIQAAVETMRMQGLDAMSRVLHQLSVLQRKDLPCPQAIDLNALIAEAVRDLRLDIPSAVTLVTTLSPELGQVLVDAPQLKQAIITLILYLRDSIQSAGKISIVSRTCGLELRGRTTQARKYIRFTIACASTAIGIGHAVDNEVSELASGTTALSGKLDLRLFTAYGVIADARGSINNQMRAGQGMAFDIVLPETLDRKDQQFIVPTIDNQADTLAVLVIEKDSNIRNLLITGLDANGFEALGAHNSQEALEWIDLYAAPVALLVAELNMEEMSGVSLAERMIIRHPELRAVFIVDRPVDSVLSEHWKHRGSRFIERPFRLEELLAVVNEMLVPGSSKRLRPDSKSFGCLTQ
jgi:two-component system cell cycle sensor histidine kinase/response regulator CckA